MLISSRTSTHHRGSCTKSGRTNAFGRDCASSCVTCHLCHLYKWRHLEHRRWRCPASWAAPSLSSLSPVLGTCRRCPWPRAEKPEKRRRMWGPHLPGPPSLRSACPADPVNIWVPGAQACGGLPGGVCGRGGVLTFWACSQGWSCPGRCGR